MQTSPSVRLCEESEAYRLFELFQRSVRALAGGVYSASQVEAWLSARSEPDAWLARRLAKPTWVAELDGAIAGFSDLEPRGHIDMLFVEPTFQRRGVANALLEEVERTAMASGLRQLDTFASLAARPVFERRGFMVEAAQEVIIGDQVLRNFRMIKRLP